MGKSARPTLAQLRELYLLVGECCELGADPLAWRQHVVEALLKLFHADVAVHSLWDQLAPVGAKDWLQPRLLVDSGWPCQSDREVCLDFMRRRAFDAEGFWATAEYYRMAPSAENRRRFVSDHDWYRSAFFNEFFRACHLDETIVLTCQHDAQWHILCLHRGLGERAFNARKERLLGLFMREYVMLLGTRLAPIGAPSIKLLSPQSRRVLGCLMEGDSEKQVAPRLGISRHTVHEYVRRLYRRFGVSSRGELLACCRVLWPALVAMKDQAADTASGRVFEFGAHGLASRSGQ